MSIFSICGSREARRADDDAARPATASPIRASNAQPTISQGIAPPDNPHRGWKKIRDWFQSAMPERLRVTIRHTPPSAQGGTTTLPRNHPREAIAATSKLGRPLGDVLGSTPHILTQIMSHLDPTSQSNLLQTSRSFDRFLTTEVMTDPKLGEERQHAFFQFKGARFHSRLITETMTAKHLDAPERAQNSAWLSSQFPFGRRSRECIAQAFAALKSVNFLDLFQRTDASREQTGQVRKAIDSLTDSFSQLTPQSYEGFVSQHTLLLAFIRGYLDAGLASTQTLDGEKMLGYWMRATIDLPGEDARNLVDDNIQYLGSLLASNHDMTAAMHNRVFLACGQAFAHQLVPDLTRQRNFLDMMSSAATRGHVDVQTQVLTAAKMTIALYNHDEIDIAPVNQTAYLDLARNLIDSGLHSTCPDWKYLFERLNTLGGYSDLKVFKDWAFDQIDHLSYHAQPRESALDSFEYHLLTLRSCEDPAHQLQMTGVVERLLPRLTPTEIATAPRIVLAGLRQIEFLPVFPDDVRARAGRMLDRFLPSAA